MHIKTSQLHDMLATTIAEMIDDGDDPSNPNINSDNSNPFNSCSASQCAASHYHHAQ
jgi:hypothetical protein